MNYVKRRVGHLNGKFNRQCKAANSIFWQAKYMWMNFLLDSRKNKNVAGAKGEKRLVIVALEKVHDGVGRAYAQVIESASSENFKPFFNAYIAKDASVVTDEWTGYSPLKKEYLSLKQVPSNNGKNFPDLHIHIMNLKGWLRGIHHHCSAEHLQGYLDEYHYRYNRRNNMNPMFDLLLKKMVANRPARLLKKRDS